MKFDPEPPTIFETTPIASDDPILRRPLSRLPLEKIVNAARIVTEYPDAPGIQAFRVRVASLRLTPEEYEELLNRRASVRLAGLAAAPRAVHRS